MDNVSVVSYERDKYMNITNLQKLNLMSCKQVANLLQISVKTVYSYIGYRQFPPNLYRKLGKKPIFIYDEVEKWFLAGANLNPRPKK